MLGSVPDQEPSFLVKLFLLSLSMYIGAHVSATDFQHRRVDFGSIIHEVKVMVVLERRANAIAFFGVSFCNSWKCHVVKQLLCMKFVYEKPRICLVRVKLGVRCESVAVLMTMFQYAMIETKGWER